MKKKNWITGVIVPILCAFITGGVVIKIYIGNPDTQPAPPNTEIEKTTTEKEIPVETTTEKEIPEETLTEELRTPIDLYMLHPLIGEKNNFFYKNYYDEVDNMNNSYKYSIYCAGGDSGEKITYALDGMYTRLFATFGLWDKDGDNDKPIWIEFYRSYEGEMIEKIGETKEFKAGVRPASIEISLEGIDELTIVTCGSHDIVSGFLLTDGIFIE